MNTLFLLLFLLDLPFLVLSFRFNVPRADTSPPLGIQRTIFTQQLTSKLYNWFFYGSVVTFDENVDKLFPEDAQVAGLAYQAFEEYKRLMPENRYATAGMNVLLIGNEAIFSSPLRQTGNIGARAEGQEVPAFFYDIVPANAEVHQQLLACRLQMNIPGVKDRHNTNGNCGEIVGMQIWHLQHPDTVWPKDGGARTTYWSTSDDKTINPCKGGGNIRRWGCLQWATQNGVSWVEEEYGYNRPDKPQVKMNVHAPSKTTVIDTLWCSGWQERPENLVPFIPKPSPSPSPSPTPKNNKRPASPYDLDDEDVADWLEAWKSIGT